MCSVCLYVRLSVHVHMCAHMKQAPPVHHSPSTVIGGTSASTSPRGWSGWRGSVHPLQSPLSEGGCKRGWEQSPWQHCQGASYWYHCVGPLSPGTPAGTVGEERRKIVAASNKVFELTTKWLPLTTKWEQSNKLLVNHIKWPPHTTKWLLLTTKWLPFTK